MTDILVACRDVPKRTIPAGQSLLVDGERAGVIYIPHTGGGNRF